MTCLRVVGGVHSEPERVTTSGGRFGGDLDDSAGTCGVQVLDAYGCSHGRTSAAEACTAPASSPAIRRGVASTGTPPLPSVAAVSLCVNLG